ncbi:uncharacterized protein LOC134231150 [Saccostrea cucullata]|uniref:uncharacterized protein LOC134231150 n=1 Tax=Saccostrea cuccullata TaxID=36930 RepID=UPI002ED1E9CF
MDLSMAPVFLFLLQFWTSLVNGGPEDMWDGLNLKFGTHKPLPRRREEAERENYKRQNDICKTDNYHGFLYRLEDDSKLLPIYDLNGYLAGIQAIIQSDMKGYNSLNETIMLPPHEIMPPVLIGKSDIQTYTITAYFKHPQHLCSPIHHSNVPAGKGLYLQTGYDPIRNYEQIPMEAKNLSSLWKKAICLPTMGTHYFFNVSRDMQCERLYPVFLMYDSEGKLGAFGWTFQGQPYEGPNSILDWYQLQPKTFYFIFDVNQLPPCMLNPNFRVFGIHIWLQSHNKTTMRCTPSATPVPQKTTTVTYEEKRRNGGDNPGDKVNFGKNPGSNIIQPPQPKKNSGINSATKDTCSMCLFLFVCILRTILSNIIASNV